MSQLAHGPEEHLYERVAAILDDARARVARTVNTAMVHAYWSIGREIVETEQHGKERAGYGEAVIARLATKLTCRFGKGFSAPNLRNMRQFRSSSAAHGNARRCLAFPAQPMGGRIARHCLANRSPSRCSRRTSAGPTTRSSCAS
jgi:hypothetical protein